MKSYAHEAVSLLDGARWMHRHRMEGLPEYGEGRSYEFGFEDGLHGKPEDAEPDTSSWDRQEWSPEHYREGYAFGALARAAARSLYAQGGAKRTHSRPEKPEYLRCHRPLEGPGPEGSTHYDGRGEHSTAQCRVLLDLPPLKHGGISSRWWEGCVGCGAVRPVDEYRGGTVKWRDWRWQEERQPALV